MNEISNSAKQQYSEAKFPRQNLPEMNESRIKPPIIQHQIIEIFLAKTFQYRDCHILELGMKFCKDLDLTILDTLSHGFKPYGITALFVLSESHCAIHYWPENYYLHIDLVTCRKEEMLWTN
jgi:S-adenosylmethionine decarboxylase